MKLGCGTLILLFLLIATLGKWLPHGDKNPPERTSRTARPEAPRIDHAPSAAKVTPPPEVPSKRRQETGSSGDETVQEVMALGATLLQGLEDWVNPSAQKAEVVRPPAKAVQPAAKPQNVLKQPLSPPLAVSPGPTKEPKRGDQTSVPASVSAGPKEKRKIDVRQAEAGKDVVFNSPWNQSVDQVERYLKHHTHDADSMSILEWGRVEVTESGYQVRCSFKTRNVLGKWTTQNKLFVMNRSGDVLDIKD